MTARARTRALSVLAGLTMLASVSPLGAVDASGQVLEAVGGKWNFNRAEQCLMHKINKARSRKGMSRLNWDKHLGVVARRHAKAMAANFSVFHDYNMEDEITHWRALGQNSGSGASCKKLFWAFMRSSGHRSNIFGRWKYMGVGVEKRGGKVFAQEVFEWRYDPGNVYRYP